MAFSQDFSGKVINQETKEAISYASVYFVELEVGTRTSEDGTFTVQGNFSDSAIIRIRALGFKDLYTRK